jgi:competence protein ComEA
MRARIRLVPGWKWLLPLAVPPALGLGAVVAAYFYSTSVVVSAQPPPLPALDVPPPSGLLVHVVGAVENPGLYRLPRGDRAYDAIAAAGGLSQDADLARLPDLAGRLTDGEQIKVAFAKTTSGSVISRVSLNTATRDELDVVPGFNDAFAQEVIDYRANFGGFESTRELVDVLGMSEAEYVIARRYLTL